MNDFHGNIKKTVYSIDQNSWQGELKEFTSYFMLDQIT